MSAKAVLHKTIAIYERDGESVSMFDWPRAGTECVASALGRAGGEYKDKKAVGDSLRREAYRLTGRASLTALGALPKSKVLDVMHTVWEKMP